MAPAVAASGEPPQDALQYVRAVKTRFIRTSPQTYEQFLEVMRDFKNARCVRKASRLPLAFLVLKFHARFRPPPPALLTPPTLHPQVRHRRGREAREKPARGTPRPAGRLQQLPPRGTRARNPRRRLVRLTRGFPCDPSDDADRGVRGPRAARFSSPRARDDRAVAMRDSTATIAHRPRVRTRAAPHPPPLGRFFYRRGHHAERVSHPSPAAVQVQRGAAREGGGTEGTSPPCPPARVPR